MAIRNGDDTPGVGCEVEVLRAGPTPVVRVRGELDLNTRDDFAAACAEAVAGGDARVLVDLTGTTFLDGSALGVLAATRRRLGPEPDALTVRSSRPLVRRILELTGMDQLIALDDGPDEERKA